MSHAVAKQLTRQATGPEMSDYLEQEIYQLCEAIQDEGQALKSGGIAQIKFIDLHRVSIIHYFQQDTLSVNFLAN